MLSSDLIQRILPVLLLLPVGVAILLRFLQGNLARQAALGFAILQFVLMAVVGLGALEGVAGNPENVTQNRAGDSPNLAKFNAGPVFFPRFVPGDPGVEHPTNTTTWTILPLAKSADKSVGVQLFIGLDGINMWMLLLASFIFVSVVLFSWDAIEEQPAQYYSWLFLLYAGVLGVFLSFDLVLFYIFFELTLIPLLFLIGNWGPGPKRRDAAWKLFLYTLAGGLITLVGIVSLVMFTYQKTGELTTSIPRLIVLGQKIVASSSPDQFTSWLHTENLIFLALAAGFVVKIPLIPVHTWLPGAYTEAPTGVTVMMSALLAKMGIFGFLRILLPLTPHAAINLGVPLLGTFAAVGILYGAFCALMSTDIRRIIAYSSISHLGFCVLGILSFNEAGLAGGILHMVNHGLSTGALFLLVGLVIRRYMTANLPDMGGIWKRLPTLTFFFMVAALASVGLPGLNNFISEMLMLAGVINIRSSHVSGFAFAGIACAGIFLGAWYTLSLVKNLFFGPLKEPGNVEVKDLTTRERCAVIPLLVMCVILGVFPQLVLDSMKADVDSLSHLAMTTRLQLAR
ncbi:MAG: NADH-quinone oxidoreductase subunit M [Zavarzinella sp.]